MLVVLAELGKYILEDYKDVEVYASLSVDKHFEHKEAWNQESTVC